MISECLGRYDRVGNGGNTEFVDTSDGAEDWDNQNGGYEDESAEEDMAKLLEESKTLLYEGCSTNCLIAMLLLLNCFAIFGVSNACADEMLKLMKEILPSKNTLPKSYYEARKYLGCMGLSYNSIHACRNGCCLYRKELTDVVNCPKCGAAKYTSEKSHRAVKILRYFPLIPRLRRMFRCASLADLNKWHAKREKAGDHVECVLD